MDDKNMPLMDYVVKCVSLGAIIALAVVTTWPIFALIGGTSVALALGIWLDGGVEI